MKHLTESQISYIIERLSIKVSPKKIIEECRACFDGLTITIEDLDNVKLKYSELLKEKTQLNLNDVRGNRLAHSRVRLDIIEQALEVALADLTPKPIRSVRVGENDYEIVTGIDTSALSAIAKLLQLAREEEFLNKRLLIELKKLYDVRGIEDPITASGYVSIDVDDGMRLISDASSNSKTHLAKLKEKFRLFPDPASGDEKIMAYSTTTTSN